MVTIKIYTLTNPLDGNIFYVGKTIDLKNRLSNHISAAKKEYSIKSVIINYIALKGEKPIIEEIDSIDCEFIEDEDIANETELYWIQQMKAWGFNLCNVFTSSSARVFSDKLRENHVAELFRLISEKKKYFSDILRRIKIDNELTFDEKVELVDLTRKTRLEWYNKISEMLSELIDHIDEKEKNGFYTKKEDSGSDYQKKLN